MHRASLRGVLRPLAPETTPSRDVCPPDSECSRAAVERVRLRLLAEARGIIPYSLKRSKGAKR